MRRLLALLAIACATLGLGGGAARADSICASSGLTILGEPWLSHQQCVPCPTTDCVWVPDIQR